MRPLALIGPPGGGKTTVGRELAAQLDRTFVDLDEVLSATFGDLGDYVVVNGSETLTANALVELERLLRGDVVVAVSSLVWEPAAAEALGGADVIYLASDLAGTFRRAGMSGPAPVALFGARALWKEMLDTRDPGYRALATHVVEVGERDVAGVAAEVRAALGW